jgi:LmbE family N-acetylglucosaminyl deacetylase
MAGRTVLAVFAHPDDESLACGGTLALLADAGARVVLLCASRGAKGQISDPELLRESDLGTVRTRELREAAAALGVADVLVLDHPDGALRWDHVPELHADIVAAIDRYRPDAVITFGEDGLYWHLDHVGVHERTFTAVKSFGAAAPPLYYVTMPHGAMRALVEAARAKYGAPQDSNPWGIAPALFGLEVDPPSFVIDVREFIPRKLAALRCHRTQMGPRNPMAWVTEDEARRWLGVECFLRSTLEYAGDAILEQLGEPVANT